LDTKASEGQRRRMSSVAATLSAAYTAIAPVYEAVNNNSTSSQNMPNDNNSTSAEEQSIAHSHSPRPPLKDSLVAPLPSAPLPSSSVVMITRTNASSSFSSKASSSSHVYPPINASSSSSFISSSTKNATSRSDEYLYKDPSFVTVNLGIFALFLGAFTAKRLRSRNNRILSACIENEEYDSYSNRGGDDDDDEDRNNAFEQNNFASSNIMSNNISSRNRGYGSFGWEECSNSNAVQQRESRSNVARRYYNDENTYDV
jgi:hypothetical protein